MKTQVPSSLRDQYHSSSSWLPQSPHFFSIASNLPLGRKERQTPRMVAGRAPYRLDWNASDSHSRLPSLPTTRVSSNFARFRSHSRCAALAPSLCSAISFLRSFGTTVSPSPSRSTPSPATSRTLPRAAALKRGRLFQLSTDLRSFPCGPVCRRFILLPLEHNYSSVLIACETNTTRLLRCFACLGRLEVFAHSQIWPKLHDCFLGFAQCGLFQRLAHLLLWNLNGAIQSSTKGCVILQTFHVLCNQAIQTLGSVDRSMLFISGDSAVSNLSLARPVVIVDIVDVGATREVLGNP